MKSCPVNAKSTSKKPVWAIKVRDKVTGKAVINENQCLHDRCGICIHACPINAITTINVPEQTEDEPPVHKYEDSMFALYRLPQLSQTKVVGLLGRNAIGKSTLIEILAGRVKPNGGLEGGHKQWMEELSIPGLHRHLLDTYAGKTVIGYKRQNLRYMWRKHPLTVGEILSETALGESGLGKDELDFLRHYLDLGRIWTKQPKVLSGGELQRLAIAHTFLQDCDLYLVDEPCTFLDVKQRIKLRKLFVDRVEEEKTSVLVVEHDLAVLDYLTDIVHVLFGEPHVFGVLSRALSTKKGVNSFLDGYIREENISFRKRKIGFNKSVRERDIEGSTMPRLDWASYEKSLGEFTLAVCDGNLYRSEVLVALGENGLGKTTFVNALPEILAQETTQSEYEYGAVSVKPQQVKRSYKGTVSEFLAEVTQRYLQNPNDKTHLLKPLGIWHLMRKPVRELSGGELQRVYIGACLGKEADIYCLDEPSAFLDAEERLKITSVIRHMAGKKKKPIIVVEHDLQVVDALADRVLLFTGEPGDRGTTSGPFLKREGMNRFLAELDITFRRDHETGRARINKKGSSLDRYQRELGEYYYMPDKNKDPERGI